MMNWSRDEFLNQPVEVVRPYAPKCLVWAAGGTRRAAEEFGIKIVPPFQEYQAWGFQKQLDWAKIFAGYGVTTLFMPVLGPSQVREKGAYRDHLFDFYSIIFSDHGRKFYQQNAIRNKFHGYESMSDKFVRGAQQLETETRDHKGLTLWWTFHIEEEITAEITTINKVAKEMRRKGIEEVTHKQAVQITYGEDVPLVDVFIGFGKLHTGYWMPALLGSVAAQYFTDFPSYQMDESHWKRIIYDYAFTRRTWTADKSNRYDRLEELGLRERHAEGRIWGEGEKNIFWYQRL